jgi:hypothetical protein
MKKRIFDQAGANRLSDFFSRQAKKPISPAAKRTYLLIERLERKRCGLCGPITENERTLAQEFCTSPNTVRTHLKTLAGNGWIDYLPGQALLKDAKATEFRRYTIAEIEAGTGHTKIHDHTPEDARFLCDIFNSRSFTYASQSIRLRFAAKSTGRIYTSRTNGQHDNPQHDNEETRLIRAGTGIALGQIACEIDYRQADATAIKTVLDKSGLLSMQEWPDDIYAHFGNLIGCSREEAKPEVNRMFYVVGKCRVCVDKICPHAPVGDFVLRLADSLDTYRATLWNDGKPAGRRPGRVHTLGGTLIEGLSSGCKNAIHQGTLLSWLIQGTIADALNKATRELVEKESEQGWLVLFPVHDSVVMLCPDGKMSDVQEIMERAAMSIGVLLKTKVAR